MPALGISSAVTDGQASQVGAVRRPVALSRDRIEALGAGCVAAALGAVLLAVGPPGADTAAHVYQRALFIHHGFLLWDNHWYDGRYVFLSYSILYYPLAAILGIAPLGAVSVGVASWGYGLAALRRFGSAARPSVWASAVGSGGLVLGSAFPFLLGAAFGALSIACLALVSEVGAVDETMRRTSRRRLGLLVLFALFATASLASSPVAFLGLMVVVAAAFVARPRARHRLYFPAAWCGALAVSEVVLSRLAPQGFYPFWVQDLAYIGGFSVVCALILRAPARRGSRSARIVLVAVALVAAGSVLAFFVPSGLGGNMARVRDVAVPAVLLCGALAAWKPRWLLVCAVLGAAWWELKPLEVAWRQGVAGKAVVARSAWAPVIGYLDSNLSPSYRVEAVDTTDHWPAAWLAGAGIPLVRGWFRQDDFPTNELLYDSGLTVGSYMSWLRSQGVKYVVVAGVPPDFSSAAEKSLVLSGRTPLRLVMEEGIFRIYEVPNPTPMLTGPGHSEVVRMGTASWELRFSAGGEYRLAVHWSPYWVPSAGCVSRSKDGMTELSVPQAGEVSLSIRPNVRTLLGQLVGGGGASCAP